MSSKHANTIVSMSTTQKSQQNVSAEPAADQKLLPACSWTGTCPIVKISRADRYSSDRYPEIDFWVPGYTNTHSKPGEANEVVPFFFLHKQGHGKVSHCALLKYNIIGYLLYRRVQDVLHQPNHYEKILFPTILKDAHLFCKETTIRNLNPKA